MLDDLIDRAWNCFNKLSAEKSHKIPPDKSDPPLMLKKHENIAGLMTLDPGVLPDRPKLDAEFQDLLDELDLGPTKAKELNNQSPEKKWLMIMEQRSRKQNHHAVFSLDSLMRQISEWCHHFPDKYSIPLVVQQLEALSVALRTESYSYVQGFIEKDGITLLSDLLDMSRRSSADSLGLPILSCFKSLLNSSAGRNCVLGRPQTLLAIVASLDFHSPRCQLFALEILAGLCLVADGGHSAVLKAFTDATPLLGERTRFQKLVDELHRQHGQPRDTERVRVALMSLVNALLKSGPAEASLEFRLHLRYELLMLGIGEVIDRLRNQHGQALEDHLDLFEMMRHEDELELSHSSCASTSSMDCTMEIDNPLHIVEHLQRKLDRTLAFPHFLSILQHMMLIPSDERNAHIWRLFDLILQQLSIKSALETSNVSELDASFGKSYEFEMGEVLTRLRTQHECEQLEKELNHTKEELDHERKKVMELENRLSDLQDGMSLSSFSRISDLSSTSSDPRQSPTPTISSLASLPPVQPPRLIPPPPPPPPPFGANPLAQTNKKKVPKPMSALRTLNWTKLPNDKIKNTVWENMNEEKLYDQLDLTELCQQFAASKNDAELNHNTIQKRLFRPETLQTVIEPRRAQNCTIMLSKLKLSHKEIRNALLSMDEKQKLPKDMIEQMLKYIPTKEELTAIQETLSKHKSPAVLPLADRFFYEVGQIQRYEQRLQCLHTMRTFQERVEELVPYLSAVSKASTTLSSSKRLKQFLALLLAIGNYLNFGKRMGNAMGFSIGSINQASNVRSSLKVDRNLLHYIAEVIENKFPDLLRIKRELQCVYEATKFTKNEMDQEIKSLQTALCFVSAELRTHQQKLMDNKKQLIMNNNNDPETSGKTIECVPTEEPDHGHDSGVEAGEFPKRPSQRTKIDKFISTVSAFVREANKALNALEMAHEDTEHKFSDCARFFAEDPAKSSPDQLFGVFTRFLNQFNDSYAMVLKEREDQERVKKQTLSRSLFSRKVNRGKREDKNKDFERLIDALQTGELFSEDLSRLRMSVRHPKNKRPAQQPAIA